VNPFVHLEATEKIEEGKQGHGLHFTGSPAEDLLTERFNEAVLRLLPGTTSLAVPR
jgi:hypothetical protein